MNQLGLILAIFIVQCNIQVFAYQEKYYRAAVVEHVRYGDFTHSKEEILRNNLKTYSIAAKTAAENGADIIVFPECGLYPPDKLNRSWVKNFAEEVPDPKMELSNPCVQRDFFEERPILLELSCLAFRNGIYLVANMPDIQKCSNQGTCDADDIQCNISDDIHCPEDEVYIYNTNVVFDRQGTIITKYHKRHLFLEFDLNPPVHPKDAFFETEFGMFTTFICFDLVFKETVEAIEKSKVINVAYPTYWFDTTPFFFANAYQQAWAMTNKVNLLAANAHNPSTGTLGSGIYSSEAGVLAYTNNPDWQSKVLISNVPRVVDHDSDILDNLNVTRFVIQEDSAVEIDEEINLKQTECLTALPSASNESLTDYNCFQFENNLYNFVKLKNNEGTLKNCMNDFCCELSYQAHSIEEDYFLGVFAGDYGTLNTFSYGFQSCFLARCESLDGESCSNFVTKSNTIFQNVNIQGNFTTKYVYPSAINSDIRLTDKIQWSYHNKSQIIYRNENNSLLFVGLMGRHYEKDKMIS